MSLNINETMPKLGQDTTNECVKSKSILINNIMEEKFERRSTSISFSTTRCIEIELNYSMWPDGLVV